MATLFEVLPKFVSDLELSLVADGRDDIADQLRDVEIRSYSFDPTCNAAYIHVQPKRSLNVVEENIICVTHGKTITVEHKYWVNLDTDNFGRLTGIELLDGGEVAEKLSAVAL